MDQQIIELYRESGNGGLVAKQLGITNYKVYAALRRNGIEPKKVGGKPKATLEELKTAYESGMSCTQVAKKFGMTAPSVVERFQNHNIKLRSKEEALKLCGHAKSTLNEQSIVDRYVAGESSGEIATDIGLKAKDGVLRVLKKHGIKARDMFGSNNPAWKGGRLKLNKLIRNATVYTEFRDRIMQERDFKCKMTGERGGKLNVHHIKPFAQMIDEFVAIYGDDIDTEDRRTELYQAISAFKPFWDEANVVVLTEESHKLLHTSACEDSGHIIRSFGLNGWYMGEHCIRCGDMNSELHKAIYGE